MNPSPDNAEAEAGGRVFFSQAGRSLIEEDQLELTSVGVDIGSSTSHLLISTLLLDRMDTRYVVVDRQVRFESEILLTPYAGTDEIDAGALGAFIAAQYQAAGLDPDEIDTGALIMTGVAARRSNARAIADLFAAQAGRFVAVSAGDGLETLMAAHGSGAVSLSGQGGPVVNIDIGGGTTKIALCEGGAVAARTALDVGARLLAFDADGRIVRLEPYGARHLAEAGLTAGLGDRLDEAQRRAHLPEIIAGRACFCIGLSEPQAGSDLAAVRSRAVRDGEGWRLNGRKIWTTNAHLSDYMIALVRSSGTDGDRHKGLSQFIVPMRAPGVGISRIEDMAGDAHFNEVTFDDVALGPEALIGEEGAGWAQSTAELAFERSGPDRYLSAFPLLRAALAGMDGADRVAARAMGDAVADLAVLRQMSVSVAGMLEQGEMPSNEAAVIKELGVAFEQRLPELVRAVLGARVGQGTQGELSALYAAVLQLAPTYSLRGGTREIMRGMIARGLGLR